MKTLNKKALKSVSAGCPPIEDIEAHLELAALNSGSKAIIPPIPIDAIISNIELQTAGCGGGKGG